MLLCIAVTAAGLCAQAQDPKAKPKGRPKITIRANPESGVAPLRVVATAEVTGGADDDQQFYCPKVIWKWGDDSESTTDSDCDPYVPGKSEIKRHYAVEHRYQEGGRFVLEVVFKQGDKEVGSSRVTIVVQGQDRNSGRSRN
jgi:hypothetical protein